MIINVLDWWCQEWGWQHCSCPYSGWCTLHAPDFPHYPAILLPNPAVGNTRAWDLDEGLKIEVSIGRSERRIVTYPWQFDTPMKGLSLNNNNWSSCVRASLQLESRDGMASLWKGWGGCRVCPWQGSQRRCLLNLERRTGSLFCRSID